MRLTWSQAIVLTVSALITLYYARKLQTKPARLSLQNGIYLIILLASSFLFNRFLYLVVALPAIPGSFDSNPVFFSLLGSLPAILALGLVGLLPSLVLGLVSGLTQMAVHGQSIQTIVAQWAFLILLAQKFSKPEERGKRSGLTIRFTVSFLELFPLIFITQLFIQLLEQDGYLFPLIQFSINSWVSMLPVLILSILLIHGVNLFSSLAWLPSRFIRTKGSRKAVVDFANRSIESLAKGHLDLPTPIQVTSLQEEVLLARIKELRDELAFRQDLVNKALTIQINDESSENRTIAMQSLLETTLAYGADSSRLLVFNTNPAQNSTAVKEKFSVGSKSELFAPMDAILINRLDKDEKLMLTDLKAKQYFGINDDYQMPKSLLAKTYEISQKETALFWVGFQENHVFNTRETGFYEAIGQRTAGLLRTVEQLNLVTDQGAWLISALDALPQSHFVLNTTNKLVFANQRGNALISQYVNLFTLLPGSNDNEEFINFAFQNSVSASSLSFRLASNLFQANYFPILAGKDQLGKVIQVINASEISETDQQKVQFLTNISHDLQAPLKLMRGYLLLLHNLGELIPEQQKYLEKIHANVDNMDILTHKLLSLEQLDTRQTLSLETVDIRKVIEDVISVLALQANQKKLQLRTDYSGLKSDFIQADRVLFQEAVFNVIDNAIKFSNHGASVDIAAFKDDDFAYIQVKDYGKGISLMDKEKIFNRFYRVEEADGFAMRGQGLGLSIAREVAEKHGGRIDLQSKLGEGSTFTIILPLRKLY
jgi:signal transduction histidine kinase